MKLLFDQNISHRILAYINEFFPDANQIKLLGLENKTDREIWNYAKQNDYIIVTLDSDFSDMLTLYGMPPKIIWLRTGNLRTKDLAEIFFKHKKSIVDFTTSSTDACLQIFS